MILDNLNQNGVFTNGVEMVDGINNDCCKIFIENTSKDNEIVRENGAVNSFTVDMIEKHKEIILASKIVVAQMKIPKEVSIALINFCNENNIPIIITPCRPEKLNISEKGNAELINKISYITANRKECETIFDTKDIIDCVKKYPNKLIVTLGSEGLMYYNGEEIIKLDAIKIDNIADTTGAGDTFNGNLAASLAKGVSLPLAIERSQYASAIKITKETAQAGMPYEAELDNFIVKCNCKDFNYNKEFSLVYNKIINVPEELKKKANKKITKQKQDQTFVTESDIFIEKFLINNIIDVFPTDNFVSEEGNSLNSIKDRTWIIDPIDGTHHYMKNSIFWGIQVAFIDKGEIQFSIVYLPKLNEIYYALNNIGTFFNHKKITSYDIVEFKKCNVEFCGSVYKFFDEKSKILKELTLNKDKVANIMHINSCCIAFTNLISGRTDALILSTKKAWDILPGIFLLKQMGIEQIELNNLFLYSKSPELNKIILNIK